VNEFILVVGALILTWLIVTNPKLIPFALIAMGIYAMVVGEPGGLFVVIIGLIALYYMVIRK